MSFSTVDEVRVGPRARVYAEGWQSWSPATWYPPGARGLRPNHPWQHTMRFRPGSPPADDGLQAEGLFDEVSSEGYAVRWLEPGESIAVVIGGSGGGGACIPQPHAAELGAVGAAVVVPPVEVDDLRRLYELLLPLVPAD